MHIGIITFHRADNYGAVLQCYALSKYLQKNKDIVEIIDYIPNNQVPNRNRFLQYFMHIGRYVYDCCFNREIIKKRKQFSAFRKKMALSLKTYLGDNDIFNDPPKYDLLISGSDQIFNTTLSGNSEAYYLGFDTITPKLSYASSFGRSNLSDAEVYLIKKQLPKFKKISVRENSAVNIVESLTGITPELVLDPVFLLDKEDWIGEMNFTDLELCASEKYVLVYLMEITPGIVATIKDIKKNTGLTIKLINGSGDDLNAVMYDTLENQVGPDDFLRLIYNAEYIVTNSFHGTAFSLIFEKKFVCISHSTRNDRIESLLHICEAAMQIIPYSNDEVSFNTNIIDGQVALTKLKTMIANSKQYLNKETTNIKNKYH